MCGDNLLTVARTTAQTGRNNDSIDWPKRATIRRMLRKHKYPHNQTEIASQIILEQAETLGDAEFAALDPMRSSN